MAEGMIEELLINIPEEPLSPVKKTKKTKKAQVAEQPSSADPLVKEVEEIEDKRKELIIAIEDKEFSGHTTAKVRKASTKVVLALHADLKQKRMGRANVVLSDLLISKFADLLGGLEAVESGIELEKELYRDEILRQDICSIIKHVTPYIPFLGLVTGGSIIAKHMYHKGVKPADPEPKE